jgi:hypothetical protein
MKKIKLTLQQLDNAEVLTRDSLKHVLGGVSAPTTTGTSSGSGSGCAVDSLGLCSGNCRTSGGGFGKCRGSGCTCS